jgi:predicted O-methyltransferase YrrM
MKQLQLNDALYDYILDVSLREHPVMQELREYTLQHPLAMMQIAPEQAQFMQFLLKVIRAKRVLELGTFTGYSALAMALALPEDGEVITCDINTEWTSHAHTFWEKSGQSHKIDLRIAPALESLTSLLHEGQQFDFIFIDADKTNYIPYYEMALKLISEHGIIAIDNVLWEGTVIDENDKGQQVREIRKLNALIKTDKRVDVSLLPIADGLFLIRRKNESLV